MKGLSDLSLSFLGILSSIRSSFENYSDYRSARNVQYSIGEIVLGGFSLFLLQNSSFLEQQRLLSKRKGSSNYQNLFGVDVVPSDATIRSNLDEIAPEEVFKSYDYVYKDLKEGNLFNAYKMEGLGYLLNIDGTQLIDSQKVKCDYCNSRKLKNGETQYYHSCVQPVISHPNCKEIIPLPAEFIECQASKEKQDCEINASKRWIEQYLAKFEELLGDKITIVGDDLYAHAPFCQLLVDKGANFVFVCKPESHSHLYSEINLFKANSMTKKHQSSQLKGKDTFRYHYEYINDLDIRLATSKKDKPLKVSFVEVVVTDGKNKIVYRNAFITNQNITQDNVAIIAAAGRNRWTVENQGFNTLKNLGYNVSHNFGHGEKYLANTLYALNILAFLFHNLLKIKSILYNKILENLPKKSDIWKHIQVITQYIIFKSWENLWENIAESLDLNDT